MTAFESKVGRLLNVAVNQSLGEVAAESNKICGLLRELGLAGDDGKTISGDVSMAVYGVAILAVMSDHPTITRDELRQLLTNFWVTTQVAFPVKPEQIIPKPDASA